MELAVLIVPVIFNYKQEEGNVKLQVATNTIKTLLNYVFWLGTYLCRVPEVLQQSNNLIQVDH